MHLEVEVVMTILAFPVARKVTGLETVQTVAAVEGEVAEEDHRHPDAEVEAMVGEVVMEDVALLIARDLVPLHATAKDPTSDQGVHHQGGNSHFCCITNKTKLLYIISSHNYII